MTPRQIQVWFRNRRQRVRLAKLSGGPADGREGRTPTARATPRRAAKRPSGRGSGRRRRGGRRRGGGLEGADERDAASTPPALPAAAASVPTHGRRPATSCPSRTRRLRPTHRRCRRCRRRSRALWRPVGSRPHRHARRQGLGAESLGLTPHLSLGESTHSSTHYSVSTHGGAARRLALAPRLPRRSSVRSLARSASVHDGAPPAAPRPPRPPPSRRDWPGSRRSSAAWRAAPAARAARRRTFSTRRPARPPAAPPLPPSRRGRPPQASPRRRLRGIPLGGGGGPPPPGGGGGGGRALGGRRVRRLRRVRADGQHAVGRRAHHLAARLVRPRVAPGDCQRHPVARDDYGASASAGGLAPHNPPSPTRAR